MMFKLVVKKSNKYIYLILADNSSKIHKVLKTFRFQKNQVSIKKHINSIIDFSKSNNLNLILDKNVYRFTGNIKLINDLLKEASVILK